MLTDGWNRDELVQDRVLNAIVEHDVPCFSGSCSEVYREKAFEHTGWWPERGLTNAGQLGGTSLMFLVHPNRPAVSL